MLVEVLFALESMASDGDSMVGGVEDVRVFELSHRRKLVENPTYLLIDIFATSKLATEFVTYGSLVAMFPDSGNIDLITKFWVTVGKRVCRKIVFRQGWLGGVGRWSIVSIGMIDRTVFGQQFGCSVSLIVGVGETKIDKERRDLLVGLDRSFASF